MGPACGFPLAVAGAPTVDAAPLAPAASAVRSRAE